MPEEEMDPVTGLIDQLTALFEDPDMVAVNCWVFPASSVVDPGVSDIATDVTVTVH